MEYRPSCMAQRIKPLKVMAKLTKITILFMTGRGIMPNKNFGVHESLARDEEIQGSSDRGFALVFGGFFLLLALHHLITGNSWWPEILAAAAAFFVIAYTQPSLLAPLNRAWTKLGLLLFKVVSPIVLGLLFYLCITPIGLLMRACGKDPLRLKRDPQTSSYWLARDPPGPTAESLKNQF